MAAKHHLLPLALLTACQAGADLPPVDTRPTENGCAYPSGAADVMTEGEVIYPYSWNQALHRDGRSASLDLHGVPCNSDEDIDWSPHDVLLFVSIPAW